MSTAAVIVAVEQSSATEKLLSSEQLQTAQEYMADFKQQERKKHKQGRAKNEEEEKKKRILREIEELGGDEQDYDLIKGLDSDEESVDKTKEAKAKTKVDSAALKKELKMMVKELGLNMPSLLEDITVEDDEISDDYEDEPVETKEKKITKAEKDQDELYIHPKKIDPTAATGKTIIEPANVWHETVIPPINAPAEPAPDFVINREFERAKQLLELENANYTVSSNVKSSERQFLSTIMRSGTMSDRTSALTLVIQESPIHGLKSLEALMAMCKKKGRTEAVSAIGAVKDLMLGSILPDRKLLYFKDQPCAGSKACTDAHLIMWAFEDFLKRYYFEFLGVMEALSMDALPFPRNHMIRYFYDLLKDKPEQEANLLRLLTIKLGDKDRGIASRTSYFCLQLMQAHPLMADIIVRQLEQVLFRPSIAPTTQYYVIITMNQTILSASKSEVANHLIDVYFTLFTKLIKEGEAKRAAKLAAPKKKKSKAKLEKIADQENAEDEANSKMISAILTGVNRAFPYSQLEENVIEKNLDTLYKVTHSANFNTSVQALLLIQQVASNKEETADRFYRTLYESVSDQRLLSSTKQALYLNLLFKSLKVDKNPDRVRAFVKRLLQSASLHAPPYICALFFLFSELQIAVPGIRELLKAQSFTEDQPAYDGRARDPRFANTSSTNSWELIPFLNHYHPSVCMFAKSWLEHTQMPSKPDLALHTISHFLDRFIYKQPKTTTSTHGGSIMQPIAGGDTRGMILPTSNATQVPVNTESFYKQSIDSVAPDEMFFYKYFNEKMTKQRSKKKKKSEVDEELDEDDVWAALVKSKPDMELDEDAFDDDELLDELDEMSEDEDEDEVEVEAENGVEVEEEVVEEGFEDGPDMDFMEQEDDIISDEDSKKRIKQDKGSKKKRKIKGPEFASAEDYLHLIEQD